MAELIEREPLLANMFPCTAKRQVEEAPAVNRWIPCSERLPEAGMPVLIYACKHRVTAYYDNCKNLFRLTENDNLYYIAEYVTHWMPLPEPPEQV